jgi:hypothetical protein
MPTTQEVRYINKVGDDGWVNGKSSGGSLLPLCMYTKVSVTILKKEGVSAIESKDGRVSFKVLDGTHVGQVLTMGEANAKIYLGSTAPKEGLVTVTVTYGKYTEGWVSAARGGQKLDQQFATLKVGSISAQVTMNTVWGTGFFPLPAASYKIMAPDVPHDGNMTTFYRNVAKGLKHDQVWFPIQYGDNSRYVHVGNVSDGCATVVDLNAWAAICDALISHRSADGRYVGLLIVKGKPERAK